MRRLTAVTALVTTLTMVPAVAAGFVRSMTAAGTPLEWRTECSDLVVDETENPKFEHGRLWQALARAMASWNSDIEACTDYALSFRTGTVTDGDVAYDDRNVLLWRLPGFCLDPAHDLEDVCLSPNAAAITTVFYYDEPGQRRDGELIEADIVLNADGFVFGDDGSDSAVDLESVLTHELGHFMGLDHTCTTSVGEAPRVDHLGNDVPSCFPLVELDEAVTEATMFNFIVAGETHKRTPVEDESRGICAVYAEHSGDCASTGGCGCRASGASGPATGWLLFVGALVAFYFRRQR